jgi:hypothetical protein
MIEQLAGLVNAQPALVRRGKHVNTTFLLQVGDTPWLISVAAGQVISVARGPFVMAAWTFALRAPSTAWDKFWSPTPEPGFHDLFALIKQRLLVAEGDLHPFMSNLFYFKGLLATLRRESED